MLEERSVLGDWFSSLNATVPLIGWSAFQVAGMSRISRAQSKTPLAAGG